MAPDDNSGARPAGPVVLRIKLRYDDLDAMVQRFAPNVGKSGLFLPTKSIQPIGTEVKFELRLANDTAVLVGLGKVKYVKPPDPANPRAAFGMAIELTRVSREGREVIIRMIERRRAMGLPDVAIPIPDDVEAARRSEVESQPRADTSGVVREAMAQFASAPVAEQVLTGSPTQSGPVGMIKDSAMTGAVPIIREPSGPTPAAAAPERHSSPLLTSPRPTRTTAEHKAVAALAPEPTRAKRPRVADLIAKATELSGPLAAAMPELDEQVDLQHALARARALAGGDLDAELAAVRESAAAPIEIGIEAASAELARQLGGKAIVKRDRSAGWAPPPAVEVRHEVPFSSSEPSETPELVATAPDPEFAAKTRAETEIAPSAVIATVTAAAIEAVEPTPVEAAPIEALAVDEPPLSTRAPSEDAAPVDEANVLESAPVEAVPMDEPRPDAALDDDEFAMELDSADLEPDDDDEQAAAAEYEQDQRTRVPTGEEIGQYASLRDGASDDAVREFDRDTRTPVTAGDEDAAAEFDRDLRTRVPSGDDNVRTPQPMLISDDSDVAEFERALDDAPDEDRGESTHIGGAPADPNAHGSAMPDSLADQLDQQLAEAEAEADSDVAIGMQEQPYDPYGQPAAGYDAQAGYDPGTFEERADAPEAAPAYPQETDDDEGEEISDFDVLAEADEDDADLMNASGEGDSRDRARAYQEPAYATPKYERPESEAAAPQDRPSYDFAASLDLDDEASPEQEFDELHAGSHAPMRPKRTSSVGDFDAPSNSYTFAENPPSVSFPLPAPSLDAIPVIDEGDEGDEGEDEFDEPHGYAQQRYEAPQRPAPGRPQPYVASQRAVSEPQILRSGQNPDDLEDALAALDVDLDDLSLDQQRARRSGPSHRPSSQGGRPLPGLPLHRPSDQSRPIAHTVPRSPTGQQPAIRSQPSQPVPMVQPPGRAETDDGILIDFEDDE